jgi:hypothetical protein
MAGPASRLGRTQSFQAATIVVSGTSLQLFGACNAGHLEVGVVGHHIDCRRRSRCAQARGKRVADERHAGQGTVVARCGGERGVGRPGERARKGVLQPHAIASSRYSLLVRLVCDRAIKVT